MLPNNRSYYQNIDRNDMLRMLDEFPAQCLEAFNLANNIVIPGTYKIFKNIIFAGMGGSAIGADLIRSFCAYSINYPLFVVRNYNIPRFVNKDSLFFACSYSGNTEETISAFMQALQRKAKIIVICSGGKLLDLAIKNKLPYLVIPKGYPPRQALGYAFFSPLRILNRMGLVGSLNKAVDETAKILHGLRDRSLSVKVTEKNNIAKYIASALRGKIPVIYSSCDYLDSVITRWRGQFAENSKTLASINVFPEMNHNEIVGWRYPKEILKDFVIILLRDKSEHSRINKRIEITKCLLRKDKFMVHEIWSKGDSLMARIFSLIYIGDFTSFYLAILNNTDPTPVKPIVYLKKKLSEGK